MMELDRWINGKTGDIRMSLSHSDAEALINEIHQQGVERLLGGDLLRSLCPDALKASDLRIKLSEEIKETTAKVYPGVSCVREAFVDDREKEYPADTRERPLEHRSVLLGEFKAVGKNGTIYLYTKAVATCGLAAKLGFETVFWATLAHNMFYAFLYNHLKKN